MDKHTVDCQVRTARRIADAATFTVWALSIPTTIVGTLAWAPKATFDDWWLIVLLLSAVIVVPYALALAGAAFQPVSLADRAAGLAGIGLVVVLLLTYGNQVVLWAEASGVRLEEPSDRLHLVVLVAFAPGVGALAAWLHMRDGRRARVR